jgi:8-oxo-dGTP diphosphatase
LIEPEVQAAGGLVVRDRDGGPEVAIVHRPRYDDWSLPKGKLDAGEAWEDAALREVEEETGLRCRLGRELDPVSYRDRKGRTKLVRWWEMTPVDGEFKPNDEVDDMRWEGVDDALGLLDYDHDRDLVRSALGDPGVEQTSRFGTPGLQSEGGGR